jgi:hypothetical protein
MVETRDNAQSVDNLQKEAKAYETAGTIGALVSIGVPILLSVAAPGVGTAVGVAAAAVSTWLLKGKIDKEKAVAQLRAEEQNRQTLAAGSAVGSPAILKASALNGEDVSPNPGAAQDG